MTAQYHATMGTKVYIGTTAASAATDSYTEIEGCKVLSNSFGINFAQIDVTALADDFKQTIKGLADGGSLQIGGMVKLDPATGELAAGQAALKAAAEDVSDDNIYNLKVERKNGGGYYFKARVFTWQQTEGQNTNTEDFTSNLVQQSLFTPFAAA